MKQKKQKAIDIIFNKYKILFISITAFLLLIAGLLGLNLYSSLQVGEGTATINASAYMRDLNQEITRDLFNLRLSYGEDPNTPHMKATINRLEKNLQLYDHNLKALTNGGSLIDADDDRITISPQVVADSAQYVQKLNTEWKTFQPLIEKYLQNARTIKASLTDLDLAVNQSQSSSIALADNTNKIATSIKKDAYARANLLTYLQLFGILAIIIYFVIFIFFVLRQLMRSDADAEEARQETTEIMQTIQEGLFLVDENLLIGLQTSDSLADIFPAQAFSGQQMEEVLSNIISSKEIDNTRRFIKQLFNERVDENLISGLNPLSRVRIHLQDQDIFDQRYVSFVFTRVWEDDRIKRVLVSVNDITESVQMEQELEKERKQNEQQVELLVKVLQISPPMLDSFLRNARQLTNHVNQTLQRPDNSVMDLKNKAREIFRDVHSFKGEAAALNLDRFVENCETIEDKLKSLQTKDKVTGNDFMSVTIALDELIECIQSIENLQVNIQSISAGGGSLSGGNMTQDIRNYYRQFAKEVGERNNKSVDLKIKSYDFEKMDNKTHDLVKEIVVQLIRNAVVHGIEIASDRQVVNKKPTGSIVLDLHQDKKGYCLKFTDDGCGINYDALRAKIKKQAKYAAHPEIVDHMSQDELNRFIFMSGMSTAKTNNRDAGRGVGMDVIRDRLHTLGGKIALRSVPHKGTQFMITIPRH